MAKKIPTAKKVAAMMDYENAYERTNPGKTILVVDKGRGWYSLDHGRGTEYGKKYRLKQLIGMIERLNERADIADNRVKNPSAYVVVAKPVAETGNMDFFLTVDDTWVNSVQYEKANRFVDKTKAELVAMNKNEGFPHRYVVVQPA